MSKLEAVLAQFKNSLERLKEVMKKEKDEFMRDSAIKRFEISFDLSWKLVKAFLEEKHGVKCSPPKSCFREAYKQKMIKHDDFWIELVNARNNTAHVYKEEVAEEVYALIPKAIKKFDELVNAIESEKEKS